MKKLIFGLLLLVAPSSDLLAQTSFFEGKTVASSSDFLLAALTIFGRA